MSEAASQQQEEEEDKKPNKEAEEDEDKKPNKGEEEDEEEDKKPNKGEEEDKKLNKGEEEDEEEDKKPNKGEEEDKKPNKGEEEEVDKKPNKGGVPIINLKIKGPGGIEVIFRIKRSTQLKKLMNAYCDKKSVNINSVAFLFDGQRLRAEQTPDELEMEDGDEIVPMFHQRCSCGYR